MCGPIPIIMGVVTAGLGIAQQAASYQQAQLATEYENANMRQQFDVQTMQAEVARTEEDRRAEARDREIAQNDLLAALSAGNKVAQANLQLMQEREALGQQAREKAKEALQAKGQVKALGRAGAVDDLLLADVRRTLDQYDFATGRQLAFSGMQTQEAKRGIAAEQASRMASLSAYAKQTILSPVEPIYKPKPSSTPYLIGGASSIMSGVSAGMSTASSMKQAGLKLNYWGFKKV